MALRSIGLSRYCVQVTFVRPRDAPKGKTTLTVVVQILFGSQFPSGGAVSTVSATPFWLRIVRVIVAVAGMFCVCITTGIADVVLIVMSGNVFGFALTGTPPMLTTFAA